MPTTLNSSSSSARHRGKLEVYAGCMFSGKTETIIRRVQALRKDAHAVAVFRPQVDTRSPESYLRSHSGLVLKAAVVADAAELWNRVNGEDEFVVMDEAQFFDAAIVDVCLELSEAGKHVLVAGLDLDFKGLPFGPMPQLMACADVIHKLTAPCSKCQEPAHFSQRLVGGRPAAFFEKVIVPGGSELYEPRCRRHHEVPGKPLALLRRTRSGPRWQLMDLANRLWAIGHNGLQFSEQLFDRERYGEILSIAAELGSLAGTTPSWGSSRDPGSAPRPSAGPAYSYATPKVAVAVALFDREGSLLLVRRADNETWALPGGWADVGSTPAENAVQEVYQETGLEIRCDRLIGVYDTRLHQVGATPEPAYTLLFHAVLVDGKLSLHRQEVLEAGFFSPDRLPDLEEGPSRQVLDAIEDHHAARPARFE